MASWDVWVKRYPYPHGDTTQPTNQPEMLNLGLVAAEDANCAYHAAIKMFSPPGTFGGLVSHLPKSTDKMIFSTDHVVLLPLAAEQLSEKLK